VFKIFAILHTHANSRCCFKLKLILLLYYITDRSAFPGDEPTRRRLLLDKIAEAAGAGVDYIQLREKDLSARDLETLAREAMQIIARQNRRTTFLINSRIDVAIAAKADGVHLRSNDVSLKDVRKAWQEAYGHGQSCGRGRLAHELPPTDPLIALSCHSPKEVETAAANSATFAVFAPVFEKKDSPGTTPAGLEALRQACHNKIPVLALGGITTQNADSCLQAGAAGVAAIRLFQENDIAAVIRALHG
jgi:thiamine-phosphate pyrophosphorylase